jgi:hypothetical protein
MMPLTVPVEVDAVFRNFMTCEFTTLGRDSMPITWPTLPVYWAERGQFVIASPIALAQKAANVRRNPRVSLLFSNPVGSGLVHPPAVLVQGDGYAPEEIVTSTAGLDPELLAHLAHEGQRLLGTQPGLRLYVANPLTRFVMGWYFVRVFIFVTPHQISWWDDGDFDLPPHCMEMPYVETDRALPA